MEGADDRRLRSLRSAARFDLQRCSSAFQSQQPFRTDSSAAHDYESRVEAAMEEASQLPNPHRVAVLPSKAKSSVEVIDVTKLTTSNQRLILSRAMETRGQDNEQLLSKIRERQDRCLHERCYIDVTLTGLQMYTCNCSCPSRHERAYVGHLNASVVYLHRAQSQCPCSMLHRNLGKRQQPSKLLRACRAGVERSRVEVQFRDVNYEAEVLLGSAGLPAVSNAFKKLALVELTPTYM